jgi:hypothetical protein
MKPPHWQCNGCGFIVTDSGSEPSSCRRCGRPGFHCIGFEGGYDSKSAASLYTIIVPPECELKPAIFDPGPVPPETPEQKSNREVMEFLAEVIEARKKNDSGEDEDDK